MRLSDFFAHGPTFATVRPDEPGEDQLVEVFRDGRLVKDWSFAEIRQRAKT